LKSILGLVSSKSARLNKGLKDGLKAILPNGPTVLSRETFPAVLVVEIHAQLQKDEVCISWIITDAKVSKIKIGGAVWGTLETWSGLLVKELKAALLKVPNQLMTAVEIKSSQPLLGWIRGCPDITSSLRGTAVGLWHVLTQLSSGSLLMTNAKMTKGSKHIQKMGLDRRSTYRLSDQQLKQQQRWMDWDTAQRTRESGALPERRGSGLGSGRQGY
jgi:hypothetical protein